MSHRAEPEHELTRIQSQSSYISLLTSDGDAPDRSKPPPNNPPKFISALRHLRLQFTFPIFSKLGGSKWNAAIEHRKTAVYKSRTVAAAHSLSHFVPFTGAVILLVLQWTEYWVSWTNDYSSSLQFAAKLHELLMQASIVEVLLCLVRTSLIDSMVPLGALTSTIQATQLSYLWSLDFFSLFRSQALQRWQRIVFLIAIPALISLTSLVGPSSAILMIPRANSPRAGDTWTEYSNKSIESLYPSQISVSEGLIVDIELYNTTIKYAPGLIFDADGYEPGSFLYDDRSNYAYTPRVLRASYDILSEHGPERRGAERSNATIPTRYITSALDPYPKDLFNGTVTVMAAYPIVEAQCFSETHRVNASSKLECWKDDWMSIGELPAMSTMVEKVSNLVDLEQISSSSTVAYFSPVWTRSPELGSVSSVVAFFTGYISGAWNESTTQAHLAQMLVPKQNFTKHRAALHAKTCTISAYWNTDEIKRVPNGRSGYSYVQTPGVLAHKKSNPRLITLNFTHADTFHTARFHRIVNPDDPGVSDIWTGSAALANVLAITLATLPPRSNHRFRIGSEGAATPNSTAFRFTELAYGYGYGARSTAVYLSMAVLLVYCVIAASYMLYTLITGSASTAWDSGTELFALALQSKKPDYLGHTSVGIDSIKTFSEGVGVRVNAENELEIMFANDRDIGTRGLTKIVRNRAY